MKRIYCSELRKMDQTALFVLNETLDEVAAKLSHEWSDYVVRCGAEVDEATEEKECRYHFVHYVYAKQDEILDLLDDMTILDLIKKVRGVM